MLTRRQDQISWENIFVKGQAVLRITSGVALATWVKTIAHSVVIHVKHATIDQRVVRD